MKTKILKLITMIMIFNWMLGVSILDGNIKTGAVMMIISMIWIALIEAANHERFNDLD